jgi:drug/metabolite transporter (DMT)-like permease
LAVTACIWGSTYIVTKSVLREVGPMTVTAVRFLAGFLVLAYPAFRRGLRWRLLIRPDLILVGLTGIALGYGLQNLGLVYTSAGDAALIPAMMPAATAALSVFLLREPLPPLRLAGVALSVAGVLLVTGGAGLSGGGAFGGQRVLGDLLVTASVLSWAVWTVTGKKVADELPAVVVSAASIGAGLIFLLPLAGVELALTGLPHLSGAGLAALVYLGVVASALTVFLWNYGLGAVAATSASLYTNLIPVVGLALAFATGERVSLWQLAGGAAAVGGVWLSERAPARAPVSRKVPLNPISLS